MRPILTAGVALALIAGGAASAQTTTHATGKAHTNQAVDTTPSQKAGPMAAGANSFTEGQAKERIEKAGYTQVSDLTKDDSGVWHGTAMKDGKSVKVALDFKGAVAVH